MWIVNNFTINKIFKFLIQFNMCFIQILLNRRILLKENLTIIGRNTVFIDETVRIGRNVTIYPNNIIKGNTIIEDNVVLLPSNFIENSVIKENTIIEFSHIENCEIGKECKIGPFSRIRPKSKIGNNVKIGNFVEIKNSNIGDRTKANHHSYIGDADVNEGCNIGCGVIFANYNGKIKSRSVVGKNCFIGSNVNIIAPVKISENSYVCAGTTLTKDTKPYDFVIGRTREVIKKGYAKKYY